MVDLTVFAAIRLFRVTYAIGPQGAYKIIFKPLRGSMYRSLRLAALLTTALLDGLFESPVVIVPSVR